MVDFELIKGKLNRYTLSSVLKSSHDLLVAIENAKDKSYPFWHVLVLVKWAFMCCKNSPFRKKATIRDVEETIVLINKYHDLINPIDFKKGIKRGFKIIAFQQFWFQDHLDEYVLFRSYVFFNVVKTNLDLETEFKAKAGLSIHEFMICNYLIFLYFNRDKINKEVQFDGILYDEDLDAITHFVNNKTLNIFLKLILFSASDIQSLQRMRLEAYQLYETTLWNRNPLIKVGSQKVLIHRSVLKSMIRHFVYEFLKKYSVPFQTEIGLRMEKYILLGIQELNITCSNEKQLIKEFELKKVCDFLIDDDILVECKAIELSPTAGIKRTKEILQNEFDTTATKAYKQLLATAHKIKGKRLYGIVITYKETLIGYGVDAWEEFLEEPITEFLKAENIPLDILPPQRLVFITLEDWDKLVQVTKHTGQKISSILEIGFKDFSENQVLFFEQVLEKISKEITLPPLTYLEKVRGVFNGK
jgi:hypothetical protein